MGTEGCPSHQDRSENYLDIRGGKEDKQKKLVWGCIIRVRKPYRTCLLICEERRTFGKIVVTFLEGEKFEEKLIAEVSVGVGWAWT